MLILITQTTFAQIIVGFQGGEPGDTWAFTSTGADATATSESMMSPNIVSGTRSLVVGGNTSGGSCIDGGSGNGPNTLRKFTFSSLDISGSSNSIRTFSINWGNRFPSCVGTGWDGGEDLVLVAYHDGIAQPAVTLAAGNNNATFSIATHQYTKTIPACVNSFYFEIYITTNRRDELLFIDNVKVTAPSLNAPVPAASPITGDATVCLGATQTLSVTSSPNTTYTWGGLPAGASFTSPNGTSASNTINIDWGTAAAGTYTITVTPSMLVCGVATPGAPSTINITVSSAPQLTVSPDVTICAGSSTTISASGAASYTWDNGLGAGSSFSVSPTTTTTYNVTGANGNCTATGQVTVTVTSLPTVSITATPASICQGSSATLTASGATAYSWDNGLGTASTVTVSPSATTTYTVTGSNGACQGTASQTITVIAPPQLTTSANTTICAGQSIAISASGATTYTWDNGLGAGSTFTVSPATTTTYNVTGSNGNCSSTGSVTITVTPAMTVSITANPTSVCLGGSTILNASGATSYAWQQDASLSATTGATVTATPTATTTYMVTGSNGTCQGTASITITISAPPAVNAGNDMTVCAGNPVTLVGSGANTYTWDNGVVDGVPFLPVATATYTLTGTTAAGCIGTDQVIVTLEAAPATSFSSDVQTGCLPLQVQFTNTSTGGTTFHWDFGDGITSTDANPLHTVYSSGCHDVTLQVTSANGCARALTMPNYICTVANPTASFTVNPAELSESNPVANMVNTSENAVSYLWNFGDQTTSTEESPVHTYTPSQDQYVITLIAYNASGCMDSIKFILPFSESPIYYVPNVFTPDGNELNQTFQPVFTAGFDPQRFHLEIFNRWGESIFVSNDPALGWDGSYNGTLMPDGTYTWKIGFNVRNSDDKKIVKGHVTLVR